MKVWRTPNLLTEKYTQSIYEWPDKPSKNLQGLVYGCIDKLTVIKHQTNKINMNLTFKCNYRIDKKMKIWTSNGKRILYYWSEKDKLELTICEKFSKVEPFVLQNS